MNLAQILRRRRRDENERGYCPCCKSWVIPEMRDFGIGAYEYWGSKEVHHDWQEVCGDCGGDMLDREPETEDGSEED